MKTTRGFVLTALAVVIELVWCGQAAAQSSPKNEAKQHFNAGNALVDNEDYAAATSEFELSVRLFPTKMGLFNLANCYKALSRYGEALEALERLQREFADKLGGLADDVASLKSTIEGMVGRLEVKVDRDGAAIRVDGTEVGTSPLGKPLVLAPGDHVIEARLSGYVDASQTVWIASVETRVMSFLLREEPVVPPVAVVAPPAPEPTPAPVEPTAAPPTAQVPEVAEQGPAPVVPAETQAPLAAPEKNNHNRAARAMGGVSTAFAVLFGAGSAVCYYFTNKWAQKFAEYRDEYNQTVDVAESQGSTAELAESGNRAWEDMEERKDSAEKMQKLGLGEAIGAGVFTALAVVLFIVGRDKEESAEPPTTVSAAPGGLAVEF